MNGMQNAPPVLPSRGPASIHRSSRARVTRPPSGVLYSVKASRTVATPSSQLKLAGAIGEGATRSNHFNGSSRPPEWRAALARIQRRKSASEFATAACIASNVGRLTALANSEASSGWSQFRRRLTIVASPLIAFIAAAHGTATCGQATISAS